MRQIDFFEEMIIDNFAGAAKPSASGRSSYRCLAMR